jgi:hypothetical protein
MSTFLAIDSYGSNDIAPMSQYFEANVYPYLEGKGFASAPYFGPMARLAYVGPAAQDPAVSLLVGVGHGTYSLFRGFQGEAVFSAGSISPNQAQGKIVHFFSCETAQQLGPAFVQAGCLAYIGYDENFTFDPSNGDTFFRCDGEIILGLADGMTVGDSVTRAKDVYSQAIAELMAQGTPSAIETAQWLRYNVLHLRSPADGPQWGRADVRLA